MANTILDRYGIKEVADVTFYEIDNNGKPGKPVLYLDTLKVSTIEQTAENAEARGGKGNAALISWDYGKEISVTLEDALYSAKSLALMFGDVDEKGNPNLAAGETKSLKKTLWKDNMNADNVTAVINGVTVKLQNPKYYTATGAEGSADDYAYVTGDVALNANAYTIDVSANGFPGTYYITGDTYARSETTGKDEFFQFIIQKAKVLSESNTITLEAEGDPTVFSMSLKVLRPKNGIMMQLVQYSVDNSVVIDPSAEGEETYSVEIKFVDADGKVIETRYFEVGEDIVAPTNYDLAEGEAETATVSGIVKVVAKA